MQINIIPIWSRISRPFELYKYLLIFYLVSTKLFYLFVSFYFQHILSRKPFRQILSIFYYFHSIRNYRLHSKIWLRKEHELCKHLPFLLSLAISFFFTLPSKKVKCFLAELYISGISNKIMPNCCVSSQRLSCRRVTTFQKIVFFWNQLPQIPPPNFKFAQKTRPPTFRRARLYYWGLYSRIQCRTCWTPQLSHLHKWGGQPPSCAVLL